MRRLIGGVLAGVAAALAGCGTPAPTTADSEKLAQMQQKEQAEADDAERANNKQQRPGKR